MEIDGLIGIWYNLLNLFDVVTISHQASLQRYIMLYHMYLWDFGFTQIPKKDGASFEALRSGYRCQQSLLPSWHGFCKIWEISKISKRWPWHIGRWPHIGAKSGRRLVESRVPQGEGTLRSSNRPEIICLPPFAILLAYDLPWFTINISKSHDKYRKSSVYLHLQMIFPQKLSFISDFPPAMSSGYTDTVPKKIGRTQSSICAESSHIRSFSPSLSVSESCPNVLLVGGIPTPLKNDGVRQLGWWNSQLFLESHSKFLGSKPPTSLPFLSLFLWFLRSTTEDEDEFYWKLIRMILRIFTQKLVTVPMEVSIVMGVSPNGLFFSWKIHENTIIIHYNPLSKEV